MYAEITLKFSSMPDNLDTNLKVKFPLNGKPLNGIIGNTIFKPHTDFHDCFCHGIHAADATLLFQITGNDLKIHIEVPVQSDQHISLLTKIESYYGNIVNRISEHVAAISEAKASVIVMTSNGSYLMIGNRKTRWQKFCDELANQKLRLIIIPIAILIVNSGAKYLEWVKSISGSVLGVISSFLAIIIWYVFDYFSLPKKAEFEYELINKK